MAWADWLLIREAWQARHPAWDFAEGRPGADTQHHLGLAPGVDQRATADGVPRNPGRKAAEPQGWSAFWRRAGLPADAIAYAQLSERSPEPYPAVVDSRRVQALCLVNPAIDDMVHGATQGLGDVLASVQLWLRDSQRTEQTIEALLQEPLRRHRDQ